MGCQGAQGPGHKPSCTFCNVPCARVFFLPWAHIQYYNVCIPSRSVCLLRMQIVYVTGAQAMCQGLLQKPGGIAYSLTGICLPLVQTGR